MSKTTFTWPSEPSASVIVSTAAVPFTSVIALVTSAAEVEPELVIAYEVCANPSQEGMLLNTS